MMTRKHTPIFLASAAALLLTGWGVAAAQQSAYVAPAQAQQPAAFTDPANASADLARIDASLNATTTFQGDFTQVGPDGSVATGKVWLSRPGKVRFEYTAPNPLLIVSDGVTLVYNDRQLETFDRVPLSATPFDYFLKENVNLANDSEVVALQKFPTEWRVSARDGSGENEGTITMVFDANTLALRQWIVTDDFGGATRTTLQNLQYNGRIDPRQFILREDSRRDRRR